MVPAYNEAENLPEVVPAIVDVVVGLDPASQVIVVDDGSTDRTAEVARELARDIEAIRVVTLGRNRGKAAALKRGFELAAADGARIVAMMDADGQDDPAALPDLVARIDAGADLVTGARMVRNDRFVKRTTSRLYNRVTGMLSGAPGRDFNSGFKVMRAEVAADSVPMLYGELHRYLTVVAHWQGYAVAEVPVPHHRRLHGSSKYGLARFWRGFMDLLTIRFLMSFENRPAHLFSGFGFLAFITGSVVLGYLLVEKLTGEPIGHRPLLTAGVLLVLVGLQLVLFGLLAELIVYSRQRRGGGARGDV